MDSFLEEIKDQPDALKKAITRYESKEAVNIRRAAIELEPQLRDCAILFTGMGSSCYAALPSSWILDSRGRRNKVVEAGELFYYHMSLLSSSDLLIAVSQSGETIEVNKVVEAQKSRVRTIGITNNEKSFLARNCDFCFPMLAGTEEMSSSKTYTNSILVLYFIVYELIGCLPSTLFPKAQQAVEAMKNILLNMRERIDHAASILKDVKYLTLTARGPAMATALQGALIMKEGAHVYAEAISGATFRHGPFEISGDGHGAIVFCPGGPTADLMLHMAADLADAGSKVVLITDTGKTVEKKNLECVNLPELGEEFFPITSILPVELITVRLAEHKGITPGAIAKGSKVTTRE